MAKLRRINPNLILKRVPTSIAGEQLRIQFRDEEIDDPKREGFSRYQACRIDGEIDEWILMDAVYALRDWLNENLPPIEELIVDPATRKRR